MSRIDDVKLGQAGGMCRTRDAPVCVVCVLGAGAGCRVVGNERNVRPLLVPEYCPLVVPKVLSKALCRVLGTGLE